MHNALTMIMDDQDDSCESYAVFLASLGFDVLTVASAEAVDADRFLPKPVPPEALVLEIVAAVAERARSVDELQQAPRVQVH